MSTRREFLNRALGAGLALAAPALPRAHAQTSASQLERNKSVVRRFKESQGTKDEAAAMKEVLAPNYKRWRAGFEHIGNNARDQGFPSPGSYLRTAFPDRTDTIEQMIAEGDMVGMLFKVRGSHKGNFNGIEPTGKSIDVYELGIFRVTDGRIAEAWFLGDDAGLLMQLGATLPPRKDGQRVVPPVTGEGEDPDAVLRRLEAAPLASTEDRNRLLVARSKGSGPSPGDRAADFRVTRVGFQHLRDHGNAKGVGKETITSALPDRRDRIDGFIAEGDTVWMRFKVAGTQGGNLYGLAPTGRRVEVPEVAIVRIVDGKWKEAWYFADELGLLLQLGAVQMLLG
ncbi:MAG TPA: ester cyclase [Xanthobacteraceae bacterium]|nr:ester cyclase [Xanthobacteraceae bacterium]